MITAQSTELLREAHSRPWVTEPSGGDVLRAFEPFMLEPSGGERTFRALLQPRALVVSTVLLSVGMAGAEVPRFVRVRPVATPRIQAIGSRAARPEPSVLRAATAGDQVSLAQSAFSMTVSDMAAVVGVSRPTIYSWLRGEVAVPHDEATVRRLRGLYELAMSWQSRSAAPIGRLLRVPVDGKTSLLDLLTQTSWNRSEIDRALSAVHARLVAAGEPSESTEALA